MDYLYVDLDYDDKESLQYEVWLLGFNKDGEVDDYDDCLIEFEDEEDALAYAEELYEMGIAKGGAKKLRETFNIPSETASIEIRVEAVNPNEDDEDCVTSQYTSYSEIIDLT